MNSCFCNLHIYTDNTKQPYKVVIRGRFFARNTSQHISSNDREWNNNEIQIRFSDQCIIFLKRTMYMSSMRYTKFQRKKATHMRLRLSQLIDYKTLMIATYRWCYKSKLRGCRLLHQDGGIKLLWTIHHMFSTFPSQLFLAQSITTQNVYVPYALCLGFFQV